MKIQGRSLFLYLISNCISIGGGKLLPLSWLPWWILFCVCCGYFINQWIYKTKTT